MAPDDSLGKALLDLDRILDTNLERIAQVPACVAQRPWPFMRRG
jgi:hypothetical protein